MNITEKAADSFAGFLCRKGLIPDVKRPAFRYLGQVWLEKLLAAGTVLIVAAWTHMLPESLLFFTVFIPLRSYSGGLHLETYAACYTGSVLSYTAVLLLTKYCSAFCPAGFLTAAGLACLAGIKLLSPVESGKRPVSEKERRRFARNLNLVLVLLTAAQLLLAAFNLRRYGFLLLLTEALQLLFLAAGKWKYREAVRKESGVEKRAAAPERISDN